MVKISVSSGRESNWAPLDRHSISVPAELPGPPKRNQSYQDDGKMIM